MPMGYETRASRRTRTLYADSLSADGSLFEPIGMAGGLKSLAQRGQIAGGEATEVGGTARAPVDGIGDAIDEKLISAQRPLEDLVGVRGGEIVRDAHEGRPPA